MQLEIRLVFFQEYMVFIGREVWSINEEYSVFQFYSDALTLVLYFLPILATGLLAVIRTHCNTNVGF